MNDKPEVKNVFQDFFKMVGNQFHSTISIFQSDNEKEYFNEYLENFLIEKYILHQSTYCDTPQQNNNAGKKNIY